MSGELTLEERERLLVATERQVMIDVLEAEPGLVRSRQLLQTLDDVLDAWRHYSNRHVFIKRMFRLVSMIGIVAGPSGTVSFHDGPQKPIYDVAYLDWFDGLIMSLRPEQKSLINYEVFHKKDRRRAEKWARKWGYSQRTYYNRLSETRGQMIMAMVNKW